MKHYLSPVFLGLSMVICFVTALEAAAQEFTPPASMQRPAHRPGSALTDSLTLPVLADLPPDVWQVNGPDLILFYTHDDILFRFDVSRQAAQPLAQAKAEMKLRADGAYLAYTDQAGLQMLDTQRGETTLLVAPIQVTTPPPLIIKPVFPHSWSSGSDLLVTIQEPLSMCSNLGWLTLTEKTFQPLLPVTDCINTAAWSPTGRRIAASSADGGHGGYPGFGVRMFDLTGPGQHLIVEREIEPGVLAAASHIAWSPDEAWLAFSLETGERNLSAPKLRLHLSRPDGRELQTLTHNTGGQADFPVWATRNTLYYALHEADTGVAGIYLYDLVDQTHTLILPGRNLQPLNLSPDGEFLLYHDAGKLKLWSLSAAKVISLTDSPATFVGWLAGPAARPAWQTHSVAGYQVTTLAIDQQGRKWFGSSGKTDMGEGSVIQAEGESRQVYTSTDGLVDSNRVTTIAIDDNGQKWIGTDYGVSTFDGQNWQTYATMDGLIIDAVNAIAIDAEGAAWFGTQQGVSAFDGQNWQTYTTTHGLISNAINAIAIDNQDHKWFGTDEGVSQFDGQRWTSYTTTHGLAFPWINAITVDDQGDKWFATHGGGISRFDGTTWTTYTAAEGLTSNIVYDLAVDRAGTLWAGTSGGVSKFDGTTWTTYTTRDGLLDNPVSIVAVDPDGHKWFGYRRGSNYGEPDPRKWVTEFDDSRWRPRPASLPVEITIPVTLPMSAYEVIDPFLVDEPAGRMYVQATGAGQETPLILILTLDGQPLTAYNLAGELALDSANGWLYVDQADNQGLAVVNTRTDRLQSVISLPEELEDSFYSQPPSPSPLAEPTTNRVIAVRDNVVYIADPDSGAIVETIPFNFAKANSSEKITDIHHSQYDPSNGILYLTFITYSCTSAMGGDCDGYTTVSYDLKNKREIARKEGDRLGQALAGYLYSGYFTCIGAGCNGRRSVWREGRPWLESTGWVDDNGRMVFDAGQQRFYEISAAYVRIYDAQTMTLLGHLPRPNDDPFISYDAPSGSLRFWDQGQVRAWPIPTPSPEPLVSAPPITTPVISLAVSPGWPTDQTLIGTWDNPALASQEQPSARDCDFPPLVFISPDGSQNWARPTGGLARSCGLAVATFSPNYALDQTLLGSVPGLGLFKSTDAGQLWQPSGAGLNDMRVSQILLSPDFMNDQIAFARADAWYQSQDGGRQWRPLPLPDTAPNTFSPNQTPLTLSPEFDQDQTILAVISRPSESDKLYLSQDGGEQWTMVGDMSADTQSLWAAPLFAQWQTLFASGQQEDQGLLYHSDDGGLTWQVVLFTDQTPVQQLVFAPDIETNRPLFALADTLYYSPDGGLTWQALETPQGVTPTALAISPAFARDRTLFIGTDQGKVLTLEVP